jgi:hypothetical protein
MTGKIFKESSNVYEDQARILFEYFQAAAVQIVSEETRLEREIGSATEMQQQKEAELARLPLQRTVGLFGGAALALLGIVLLIMSYSGEGILALMVAAGAAGFGFVTHQKMGKLQLELSQNQSTIDGFNGAYAAIRRDFKVYKLGLAYVPVARVIPFEGKSFQIDLTGSTPPQDFRLSVIRRGELFSNAVSELESLILEAPFIEGSSETERMETDQYSRSIQNVTYYDYLGSLDRTLRSIAFCLDDLDTTSVALPVIPPESPMAAYLSSYAADDIGAAPVFPVFNTERFNTELESFRSLNEMKKSIESRSAQFEEVLKKLIVDMARAIQAITRLKISSANKLVEWSNRVLFTVLNAPYNHYSPTLEAEEIDRIRLETFNYQDSVDNYRPFQLKKSSRVKYDIVSDCWMAEDGSKTTVPFGMNQIQEEVITPIIHSLMQETRLERLNIYNAIKDQKINYLNQWHQDTEDFYGRNRAESSDLINLMRSTFTEFIASYNSMTALEKTNESMSKSGSLKDAVTTENTDLTETTASFEMKSRDFQAVQNDFVEYMERLKEDIDHRASKFSFIEYYDASLRDSSAKMFAEATTAVGSLNSRRRTLLAVNPLFASTSQLPPEPAMEPGVYDGLALNLTAAATNVLAEIDAGVAQ